MRWSLIVAITAAIILAMVVSLAIWATIECMALSPGEDLIVRLVDCA